MSQFKILRSGDCPPRPAVRPRRDASALLPSVLLLGALAASAIEGAVIPWMDLDEMTRRAEVIALGKVETSESAWSDDGRIIVTRVTVAVERSLKGGPRSSLVVETPGGKVGDSLMVASSAPVFSVGDRVVLFLERVGQQGRLGVVGWNQGAMHVRRDPHTGRDLVGDKTGGSVYLDRDGRRVSPELLGAGPVELGQFLRHVEDLVARIDKGSAP